VASNDTEDGLAKNRRLQLVKQQIESTSEGGTAMKRMSKLIVVEILASLSVVLLVSRLSASPSYAVGSAREFASPGQVSPPLTAKAQLANARNLAKKWQGDASLVDILGPSVDANGVSSPSSSYAWSYTFISKKADKVLMISVGNAASVASLSKMMTDNSLLFYIGTDAGLTGSVQERTSVGPGCQPLPAEFLDNDKAMAAAKAAGYKPGSQIDMHLSRCDTEPANWKTNAFKVDAVTGKPLK